MVRITKAEYSRRAKKAVAKRKENQLERKRKRAASIASRKNILSEDKFVEKLRRKGFLAFKTGKAEGPPDIVAYKGRRLRFYEIKPSQPRSSKDALFKKSQSDWIMQHCFKKKIEFNLAYYKGSRPFKYAVMPITRKNISGFVNNQKNRDNIIERIKNLLYK